MSWREKLTQWAAQLQEIGIAGAAHASTIYEKDNHHAFQRVAASMATWATDEKARFSSLASSVSPRMTPFTVADAAVIDDDGRLLMIRRADNNMWALPGGALEVGETIATGAAREAHEETGVRSEPIRFVGVWDSRLYLNHQTKFHMYQFVILCRPLEGATISRNPSHVEEIKEIRWFAENDLPSVDEIDGGHSPRLPYAFAAWRGERRPFFNPINETKVAT